MSDGTKKTCQEGMYSCSRQLTSEFNLHISMFIKVSKVTLRGIVLPGVMRYGNTKPQKPVTVYQLNWRLTLTHYIYTWNDHYTKYGFQNIERALTDKLIPVISRSYFHRNIWFWTARKNWITSHQSRLQPSFPVEQQYYGMVLNSILQVSGSNLE